MIKYPLQYKNKNYGEFTFHYWFWKNILSTIKDNAWVGFCAYRKLWFNKNNITNNSIFQIDETGIASTNKKEVEDIVLKEIPKEWENFDTVIGQHFYLNNLKLSKLLKHGKISLIRNPYAFFKSRRNIRFHFDMWHGNGNLDKAIDLLDDNNREDFRKYTRTNVSFSFGAMFVCRSKKILNDYYTL